MYKKRYFISENRHNLIEHTDIRDLQNSIKTLPMLDYKDLVRYNQIRILIY